MKLLKNIVAVTGRDMFKGQLAQTKYEKVISIDILNHSQYVQTQPNLIILTNILDSLKK